MEKIGLIAGNRRFPIVFSQAAKKKGYYIAAVAIKGDTQPQLKQYVDKIHWIKLNEFSRMRSFFNHEGITKVVMAGQVSPRRLFSKELKQDSEIKKLLESVKDNKADTIFGAVADQLKNSGFELLNSTLFMEELMPKKGTLTKGQLSHGQWEDVYFGLELAREVASLDIGQSVAVKNKAVVAVEALEGTDNLICRAGRIAGAGVVIVKVSKPHQDLRFDVPVIGLNTIKNLARIKASCLAIEAAKTLFIDREPSIKLADKKGIVVVAV